MRVGEAPPGEGVQPQAGADQGAPEGGLQEEGIPPQGHSAGGVQEDKYLATGSGSPIAMGILESGYRDDLAEDEAILLALRALSAAMKRDTATGDGIDLVVIKKEGIKTFTPKEIDELLEKIKSRSKK